MQALADPCMDSGVETHQAIGSDGSVCLEPEAFFMDSGSESKKICLTFSDVELVRHLFGQRDDNLRRLGDLLKIDVHARANTVHMLGEAVAVDLARRVLEQLYGLLKEKYPVYPNDFDYALRVLRENYQADLKKIFLDTVFITSKKRAIAPRNQNQKTYIEAIRNYDIVFGIGPAGTGKTYLAMAMAVSALTKGTVSRIILTRPAVEAGESLGFLPGDLTEKVDPYLRPLYDALHDMLRFEKVATLMQTGVIEVAPLAFMRGRTLNDAFIILDEAQNTTTEQMKMFLTRIGFNSKAVVTGDITQIDLPTGKASGLIEANTILTPVSGIGFVHFNRQDVVRHRLVQDIINAYELLEASRNKPAVDPSVRVTISQAAAPLG